MNSLQTRPDININLNPTSHELSGAITSPLPLSTTRVPPPPHTSAHSPQFLVWQKLTSSPGETERPQSYRDSSGCRGSDHICHGGQMADCGRRVDCRPWIGKSGSRRMTDGAAIWRPQDLSANWPERFQVAHRLPDWSHTCYQVWSNRFTYTRRNVLAYRSAAWHLTPAYRMLIGCNDRNSHPVSCAPEIFDVESVYADFPHRIEVMRLKFCGVLRQCIRFCFPIFRVQCTTFICQFSMSSNRYLLV